MPLEVPNFVISHDCMSWLYWSDDAMPIVDEELAALVSTRVQSNVQKRKSLTLFTRLIIFGVGLHC